MTIQIAIQTIVYGVLAGGIYGLVAAGLQLVFGITKIINIAHGPLIVVGSFLAFWALNLYHIDPFASFLPVAFILALLGLVIYRAMFYPVTKVTGHAKINLSLLLAFGLMLIVQNGMLLLWTGDERALTTSYTGTSVGIFGIWLPYIGLAALALAGLVIFAVHLLLMKTYFGKSVRALIDDWEAASLVGVNIKQVHLLSFGVGAALAGAAGVLVALTTSFSPVGGMVWTFKGLIVVILAGMGNIPGVFLCGLLLGVVEAIGVIVGLAPYREVFGLVAFVLVLMFKPEGLFTRAGAK